MAQITDEGHKSLSRYHKDEKPEDLKHSLACFERALQACALADQCRAVVLFNLATARLISCQVGITSPDFDVPITLYRDALDLRPVGHPDRLATVLHLARATMSRFLHWGGNSYAAEATSLIAEVQGACSVDSYEYRLAAVILQECAPDWATDGCMAIAHSSDPSTSTPELEDEILHTPDFHPANSPMSIPELENVILHAPNSCSQKPAMLTALALALLMRFERVGNKDDINGSIVAIEQAVGLTQESHFDWPQRAVGLGVLLGIRSCRSNTMGDLERSISVLEKVIHRMPDGHLYRPLALLSLGIVHLERFGRLGQIEDIDKSVSTQEEGLALVPNDHPHRPRFLSLLGATLLKRFEHLHNIMDLDKSISLIQEADRCTPHGQVATFSRTNRMEPQTDAAAIHSAVFARNGALRVLLDSQFVGLRRPVDLGHAFHLRFAHLGDPADLDKSISTREKAIQFTPRSQKDRPVRLARLGYTFLLRYVRLGNLADLHNSTSILAEAVRLTPDDDPHRSEILVEFGISLMQRFNRLGNIVDIDKSISMEEEAIRRTPNHHPSKPLWLISLGGSLLRRFQHLGGLADLDKSTSMMDEGVRLTPVDDLDRPRRLCNLGSALRVRFDHLEDLSDLNKSISTLEEVAHIVPDGNIIKRGALVILASALLSRSERLRNAADHDKSISVGENAVKLTPDDDPVLPDALNTVGISLLRRFLQRGDTTDLDRSTWFMEKALHLMPEDHPQRSSMLFSIGSLFGWHFNTLRSVPALRSAISYFAHAARSQASVHPSVQFQAFKGWIQCANMLHPESCLEAQQALFEAFECAISLFPRLAWIGLPVTDRYANLLEAAVITRSAVCVAVVLGHIARAVEWLEQGRCIVWGQLFQFRTPLDELRQVHPDLADRMEWLSSALAHSSAVHGLSDRSLSRFSDEKCQGESLEQQARQHRELVTERENLLQQVQALPGFERSFLPKTFSQLRASAHLGPIVLLNVNARQGDALIVVADLDEPVYVPLLGINDHQAEHLRTSLNKLLSNDGRVLSRDDSIRAARPVVQDGRNFTFTYVLSALWTKVVKPILHALALTVSRH